MVPPQTMCAPLPHPEDLGQPKYLRKYTEARSAERSGGEILMRLP